MKKIYIDPEIEVIEIDALLSTDLNPSGSLEDPTGGSGDDINDLINETQQP